MTRFYSFEFPPTLAHTKIHCDLCFSYLSLRTGPIIEDPNNKASPKYIKEVKSVAVIVPDGILF
jgi:hypothetical protein